MDLERADGHRRARDRAGQELQPELLVLGEQVVHAVDVGRLDRRDVQRELQRVPHSHRTPFESIGVGRRPAPLELGHDVHEHRRRGHGVVVEAGDVADGLDRGSRLAVAGEHHVVLGREVLVLDLQVVVGAAADREDLARAVVDHRTGAVVDVLAAQVEDP